jgi:transposase
MPRKRNSQCPCGQCEQDGMAAEQHQRWLDILSLLNERQARLYVAEKAIDLGHGGITKMAQITGMTRQTIAKGIGELRAGIREEDSDRIRQMGGGRKRIGQANPQLLHDLNAIMEGTTGGDPMSSLKWTSKSTRRIAEELVRKGHAISHETVCRLLYELGFSLRGNVKSLSQGDHPQRDAQFRYIADMAKAFHKAKMPVISVDTKKREKVGEFKNPGRNWRRQSRVVNAYDFPHLAEGKAIPYGIYATSRNTGMVRVGVSRDTAEFAVDSIKRWWRLMGQRHYSPATRLLIFADGGGSNGSRNRLWKQQLQKFADACDLEITVCHYPPGTSKWNKIEHRMFSHISLNWKGEPLTSYETVINLINGTRTKTGLKIRAELTQKRYRNGIRVSDADMKKLNLEKHNTHPHWNYTIRPRST